jgi:hypothetical protein
MVITFIIKTTCGFLSRRTATTLEQNSVHVTKVSVHGLSGQHTFIDPVKQLCRQTEETVFDKWWHGTGHMDFLLVLRNVRFSLRYACSNDSCSSILCRCPYSCCYCESEHVQIWYLSKYCFSDNFLPTIVFCVLAIYWAFKSFKHYINFT